MHQSKTSQHSAAAIRCQAPARINIIGEHTDYNSGFVLPMPIPLFTRVSLNPRTDREVTVRSVISGVARFHLDDAEPGDSPEWQDYIRGVAAELGLLGVPLCGADITIDSDIPMGAGLSSSAALEVATARAWLQAAQVELSVKTIALACQRAEQRFAKVNCGIMDQLAVAAGTEGNALLIDCERVDFNRVAVPGNLAFLLIDSGVRHKLNEADYNRRTEECQQAVDVLAAHVKPLRSLRGANLAELAAAETHLSSLLYRRARHVVTENQRVLDTVRAFRQSDLDSVGQLLSESHSSLQNDYEVSCNELDCIVESALQDPAVYGARMVGAGFGGCVLVAVPAGQTNAAASRIVSELGDLQTSIPLVLSIEHGKVTPLETC